MFARKLLAATACALIAAGCQPSGTGDQASTTGELGAVGVILPDAATSARWENSDRPFLKAALEARGISADIQNAGADVAKFQSIADGMIASGVKALLIVNLDNESGAAVIKKATAAGIPVIDYDRLTLGGGARYYVSFDNVAVGRAIGDSLVSCLKSSGVASGGVVELNGAPTDNNATLFKQGYDGAIRAAGYSVVADQAVPEWDNARAGVLFEQIDTQARGRFVGVAAANDGLAGAVIARLRSQGLAGKIPVVGQDATDEGLQRVLLGEQCATVYKAVKQEAEAAADLVAKILQNDTAGADALASGSTPDTKTGTPVRSVLLTPKPIFKAQVKDVIADGYTTRDKICTTDALKKACTDNGV